MRYFTLKSHLQQMKSFEFITNTVDNETHALISPIGDCHELERIFNEGLHKVILNEESLHAKITKETSLRI